jgi:ABC-type lipoprotein release transport system permease subunit
MVLSYHAVTDIRQDEGVESIRFAVPWLQVGLILAVTYLFSLLATFLPARQAARIYPAEALRYE